jgi:chromosome segregation protein
MRIKQLILNGFKSFAEKTVITFDPTINAIIGPNGCGKSNILDGLRWVMGEASFTQMRCAKTEDLIFAGNKFHPPVNYAEVILILETTPKDEFFLPHLANLGSEIEIKRRYYRSGESEFFINRRPCKLKDIQDLFTSGGGSGQAYSIFDLPTMRRIISDNLKELFIEASGLAFYRERKEEIERKLKLTNDDLLRLKDIISERMRITRNLKRQAYRLRAYEKVKNEERKLQIALLRIDYQKILGEEKSAEEELNKLQAELIELEKNLTLYEEKRQEYKKALAAKEIERANLSREIENLKEQLVINEERLKNNLEKQEFYQSELKKLHLEISSPEKEEISNEEILEKKIYLDQIKELYRKKEEEFEKLRQKNKELESAIYTAQLSLEELETKDKELYLQIAELHSTITTYQERLNTNQHYLATLKNSREALQKSKGDNLLYKEFSLDEKKILTEFFNENFLGFLNEILMAPEEYQLAISALLYGLEPLILLKELKDLNYPPNLTRALLIAPCKNATRTINSSTLQLPPELKKLQRIIEVINPRIPLPEKIINLINHSFIVDDLSQLIYLKELYPNFSFATKSGIAFRADGVLVILPSRQIIGQPEIIQKLSALQQEINFLTQQSLEIQKRLEASKEKKSLLEKERGENLQNIQNYQKLIAQMREENKKNLELANSYLLDLHKRREEIVQLQGELDHITIEINRQKSHKETITTSQKNLEEIINRIKEEEKILKRNIETIRKSLETKQKEFEESDWNILNHKKLEIEEESNRLRILIDLKRKNLSSHEFEKLKLAQERERLETEASRLLPDGKELLLLSENENLDIIKRELANVGKKLALIGLINPLAQEEYEKEKEALDKLLKQENDVLDAKQNLINALEELTKYAESLFRETYEKVKVSFQRIFGEIFLEGEADLLLETPNNPLESEIKIIARPRGKNPRRLDQLSDGEKALLALSLLFAFYDIKPAPFVFMDEVDAPLDDANVKRFNEYLKRLSETTQVIIITHNKITIETASAVIGVTTEKAGISKTVSVRIRDFFKTNGEKASI